MSKYDVIHKIESTYHITKPPEENRATATGNMHKELVKIGRVVPKIGSRKDKHTHTDADRQTDTLITILRSLIGVE